MKHKRKKRIIDRDVQGALAKRIILHWFLFLAIAVLALPLWQLWSRGFAIESFSAMMIRGWRETAPVFFVLIAMLPLFVIDTLTFSHRFAGPMYRFRQTIKRLAAGEDVSSIKLRKGDFWKGFADDFNAMLQQRDSQKNNATAKTETNEQISVG